MRRLIIKFSGVMLLVLLSAVLWAKGPQGSKPKTAKLKDHFVYTSPVIADLLGNGSFEIIAAGTQRVYVLHPNLTTLEGWPKELLKNEGVSAYGTPAVGDMDGDGRQEVVVLAKGEGAVLKVYVWDAQGVLMPGWPQAVRGTVDLGASVVLADLEGDGKKEVIFSASLPEASANPGVVYVFRNDGSIYPGWPQQVPPVHGESQWLSTPSVGVLSKDGKKSIVVATGRGQVYAWSPAGQILQGWPVEAKPGDRFSVAPVLADIEGAGVLDVLIGSGNDTFAANFYVWRGDGSFAKGWPQPVRGNIQSEVAVGSLDAQGEPEIVFGTNTAEIFAFHHNGLVVKGWPQQKGETNFCNHPLLVDLKGNGKDSVIIGSQSERLYIFRGDGTPASGWPQALSEDQKSMLRSPALAAWPKLHSFYLAYVSNDDVYLWKLDKPVLKKGKKLKEPNWPMFRYDTSHTGAWPIKKDR